MYLKGKIAKKNYYKLCNTAKVMTAIYKITEICNLSCFLLPIFYLVFCLHFSSVTILYNWFAVYFSSVTDPYII